MAHKNVDYDPESLRYPEQKIVQSELVKEKLRAGMAR